MSSTGGIKTKWIPNAKDYPGSYWHEGKLVRPLTEKEKMTALCVLGEWKHNAGMGGKS